MKYHQSVVLITALTAAILLAAAPVQAQRVKKPAVKPTVKSEAAPRVDPADPLNEPSDRSARAIQYEAILKKSKAISAGSLSPRDLNRFNADLASIRSELRLWAKTHDVKLVNKQISPEQPSTSKGGTVTASCPSFVRAGDQDCVLVGMTVVDGEAICDYECSKTADKDRQVKAESQ